MNARWLLIGLLALLASACHLSRVRASQVSGSATENYICAINYKNSAEAEQIEIRQRLGFRPTMVFIKVFADRARLEMWGMNGQVEQSILTTEGPIDRDFENGVLSEMLAGDTRSDLFVYVSRERSHEPLQGEVGFIKKYGLDIECHAN